MIKYTDQTIPKSTPLVTSGNPTLVFGALIPGPPCPCIDIQLLPSVISRSSLTVETKCIGLQSRITTTTYVKQENPYTGEGEDKDAWDDAWPTMTHTVEEMWDGPKKSKLTTYNAGALNEDIGDPTECGTLVVTKDEWDPGPPDDNPGIAIYDHDTVVEETEIEDGVGAPDADGFIGEMLGSGQGYTLSRNEADTENLIYSTEWRWRLSLDDWPAVVPWPPGLVIRGRVYWRDGTIQFDNDDPPLEDDPYAGTFGVMKSEEFEITESERVWTGTIHSNIPPGGIAEGKTRAQAVFLETRSPILLPFA